MNPIPGPSGSSWVDDAPMPPPGPEQFPPTTFPNVPPFGGPHFPPPPRFGSNFPMNIKMEPVSPLQAMSLGGSSTPGSSPYTRGHDLPGPSRHFPPQFSSQRVKQELMHHIQQRREDGHNPLRSLVQVKCEPGVAHTPEPGVMHIIPEETLHAPSVPVVVQDVRYDVGEWVEVFSYELDDQVPRGSFATNNDSFHIDGLTKSENLMDTPRRFCLGALVVQTNLITFVKQIGKGVEIRKDERGNVILENVSKSTVFVQCPNYASKMGDELETVYRLCSPYKEPMLNTRQLMIFDSERFSYMINDAKTTMDLSNLSVFCFTRVSFLKGFGRKYPNRPEITKCPIWVEIKMMQPLAYIDKKFEQLLS